MITVGFGRLALFNDIPEQMISTYFNVNTIGVIRVIKHYYDKLLSPTDFHCGVMVSIAGFMSSPFFSLYGATKAGSYCDPRGGAIGNAPEHGIDEKAETGAKK